MLEKKIKHRLHKAGKSEDAQVDRKLILPEVGDAGSHVTMAGVRLIGKSCSAKGERKLAKKQISSCSFLPKEIGRKNLVSSADLTARIDHLEGINNSDGRDLSAVRRDVRLPDLTTKSFENNRASTFVPKKQQEVSHSGHRLAESCRPKSFRMRDLDKSQGKVLGEPLKLPKMNHNGLVTSATYVSLEQQCRAFDQHLSELEFKRQLLLPNLNPNCELVGRNTLSSAGGVRNSLNNERLQSRKGPRAPKSGKNSKKSPVMATGLPNLVEKEPFDEKLVGKQLRKFIGAIGVSSPTKNQNRG